MASRAAEAPITARLWALPEGKQWVKIAVVTGIIALLSSILIHVLYKKGSCSNRTVKIVDTFAFLTFMLPSLYFGKKALTTLRINEQIERKKAFAKRIITELTTVAKPQHNNKCFFSNWQRVVSAGGESKEINLIVNFIREEEWQENDFEGQFFLKICNLCNNSVGLQQTRGAVLMRAALELGANPNVPIAIPIPGTLHSTIHTPIGYLITKNEVNIELLRLLLENNANVRGKFLNCHQEWIEKGYNVPLHRVLTELPPNTPQIVTLLVRDFHADVVLFKGVMRKPDTYVGAHELKVGDRVLCTNGSIADITRRWEQKYSWTSDSWTPEFVTMLQLLRDHSMPGRSSIL